MSLNNIKQKVLHSNKKDWRHYGVMPTINGIKISDWIKKNYSYEVDRSKTIYISLIAKNKKLGIHERIFAIKLKHLDLPQWQEIGIITEKELYLRNCYISYYGICNGFYTFGFDKKNKYFSKYSGCGTLYFDTDFYSGCDILSVKIPRNEMFDGADVIALDEKIKFCGWHKECGLYFMDYLKLYRQFPIAEMLMKLKLPILCNPDCLKMLTDNPAFRKYVFKNADGIRNNRAKFTTVYNAFKKNKVESFESYNQSLRYRVQCGKDLAIRNKTVYAEILKYTTQEKLKDYINKNKIDSSSYSDYIEACLYLKLDLNDTKNLFPLDFAGRHDLYCLQLNEFRAEAEKKRIEKEYKDLSDRMMQTAIKFNFLNYSCGAYCVIVAQSKQDLINEGQQNNNCVGKMSYDKKHADGKSIICFLRKNNDVNKSFVTMEVNPKTLDVIQCYEAGNKPATDEVKQWVDCWRKLKRKELKKIKIG